uniref:C2H2-type domain-containing protein n=1 Tax=Plectus sambesii TaxID=2011161 RepID=A0A914UXK9_9BILA
MVPINFAAQQRANLHSAKKKDPLLELLEFNDVESRDVHVPDGFDGKCHECVGCGNKYALKTSLKFHLDRCVMHVEVHCGKCRENKTFYNRCRYKEHALSHDQSPANIFSDIQVSIIHANSVEKLFDQWFNMTSFKQASSLPVLYRIEHGKQWEPLNGSPDLAKSTHIAPSPAVVTYRCTECRKQLSTADELRTHFAYNLPQHQRQLICQESNCMAVYFSKCSYTAHVRCHKPLAAQTPFTCAECGISQSSSVALSHHLLEHKTAPTVLNAWRCSNCSMFYANFETVVQHTASAHCPFVFKCYQCNISSKDPTVMQEHAMRYHPEIAANLHVSENPAFLAIKCFACDQLLEGKEALIAHVRTHMSVNKPFKIYRCPVCGRLLENKSGLIAHYDRVHRLKLSVDDIKETLFTGNNRKRPLT